MRTDPGLPGAPAIPVPVLLAHPPCSAPGCGKTHTMLGTDLEPGIYVRTLNDLFRAIEETSDDMEYEVSMSYLEVSPRCTPSYGREPGGPRDRAGLPPWGQVRGQSPGGAHHCCSPMCLWLERLREVRQLDRGHTVSEGTGIQTHDPAALEPSPAHLTTPK